MDFDSFFDYQDHQFTHNGQLVFCCSKCDKVGIDITVFKINTDKFMYFFARFLQVEKG